MRKKLFILAGLLLLAANMSAEKLDLTLGDLTVKETETVEFTAESGTGYVAQSKDFDLTGVLATLGVEIADAHVVSVLADGSLDTELGTGGDTQGWRDDTGDWAVWGTSATFRCQASLSGSTLAFTKVSGHQTRGTHMTDVYAGCVYTAHYAVYNEAKSAVAIDVKLTYTAKEKPAISNISALTVKDTKTVEFTAESGTGYVAQSKDYDLTEVLTTLGVDIADAHVVSVMADGSIDEDLSDGGTSGWRDDTGDWAGWGTTATWRCQASVSGSTLKLAKVSGHQTRGTHMTNVYAGCVYTAHYAVYNESNDAVAIDVKLTYTAKEKPAIASTDDFATILGTKEVDIETTVGKSYENLQQTIDLSDILTALGVASVSDVKIVSVQSDKSLVEDYGVSTTDGWRNADGDWASWSDASTQFCIKADFTTDTNQIYYAGSHDGHSGKHLTEVTTYTAKYAFYTGTTPEETKAYYLNVNLVYKEAPKPAIEKLSDLKVADTKNVEIKSMAGLAYEGLTANIDVDAIVATLGAASIGDVTIVAVESDGTLDLSYELGTTDGWRNADGDWSGWGEAATQFCIKADFTADANQINYAGGHDGHSGAHLTGEVTYTAKYAFFVGTSAEDNKAVVLNVNFIYELNEATLAVTDSKYATFVAPFAVATLPAGVKAYTVDDVNDAELVLTEVTEIAANTPVVLYSETVVNETVKGAGVGEGTVTKGLLVGVYADTAAPAGSYVLQSQADGVKFYLVGDVKPTVKAGHAYITLPEESGVKALGFDAITTAIHNIDVAKAVNDGAIYNLAGQQLNRMQKGINIVNGKKVLVK